MDVEKAYVLWFGELHRKDVALVGGKSSSLGELTTSTGVPVPYDTLRQLMLTDISWKQQDRTRRSMNCLKT